MRNQGQRLFPGLCRLGCCIVRTAPDPVLAWALSQAVPRASLGVKAGIPDRQLDGTTLFGRTREFNSIAVACCRPAGLRARDQCQAYLIY